MIATANISLCEKTNHIRLVLLYIGHAIVGREWQGTIINPDVSRLYYISKGNAVILGKDGSRTELTEGKWVLLPAGFSFDFSCGAHMEHIYCHLKLCDLDGLDMLASYPAPAVFDVPGIDERYFIEHLQNTDITSGLLLRHRIEEVLLTFLSDQEIRIEYNQYSPCVVKAIKYIKRHLSAQLTVSEVAEHVFVSNSTLTKRFKTELSKSVGEYINDTIMFEAGQLLLKTNLSILAVSEKYGFSDQFYFSRRFKEKFGMSPMKYRRSVVT